MSGLLGASSSAVSDPVTCVHDEAVSKEIMATLSRHVDAHFLADSTAATELYLEDVDVFFGGVSYDSKADMVAYYESIYSDYEFRSLEYGDNGVWVCGDTAYSHTTDSSTLAPKTGGRAVSSIDHAMVTWKLQADGEWRVSAVVEIPEPQA